MFSRFLLPLDLLKPRAKTPVGYLLKVRLLVVRVLSCRRPFKGRRTWSGLLLVVFLQCNLLISESTCSGQRVPVSAVGEKLPVGG